MRGAQHTKALTVLVRPIDGALQYKDHLRELTPFFWSPISFRNWSGRKHDWDTWWQMRRPNFVSVFFLRPIRTKIKVNFSCGYKILSTRRVKWKEENRKKHTKTLINDSCWPTNIGDKKEIQRIVCICSMLFLIFFSCGLLHFIHGRNTVNIPRSSSSIFYFYFEKKNDRRMFEKQVISSSFCL